MSEYYGNIDELKGRYFVVATAQASGNIPNFGGNRFILIGDSVITPTGLLYGVQLCFGFGSNKIFIRNCSYKANSDGVYSGWRII